MSARNELAGVLAQWRQLTREEGRAIQASQWLAVRRIQLRKADLKKALAEAAQQCSEEEGVTAFPFRAELARIISMVTRNGELLAAQVRRARAGQESLDQTRRNLQRIQRSYAPAQPRAAWHSYS